jgi:hypothetical protein
MKNDILDAFCALSLQTNLTDNSLQALAMDVIVELDGALTAKDLVTQYDALSPREFAKHVKSWVGNGAASCRAWPATSQLAERIAKRG